jgi:hypothetical protein
VPREDVLPGFLADSFPHTRPWKTLALGGRFPETLRVGQAVNPGTPARTSGLATAQKL